MQKEQNTSIFSTVPKVVRKNVLTQKVVIVDGQPGCGKTMLSPIVGALDRVELMSFPVEIEFICRFHQLGKISEDAAAAWVKMMCDHRLYHGMMGREMNCRWKDLSSVFRAPNPLKYLVRFFQKGDEIIPERIQRERPILHLAAHNLLADGEPFFAGLQENVLMIHVVRHPLYMVKQQALNMERLPSNPRNVNVYFEYQDMQLPYYVHGWEELYLASSYMERAVYLIDRMTRRIEEAAQRCRAKYNAKIITVPFEKFVLAPEPYLQQIVSELGTRVTWITKKEMKRQKVPRRMIADGINLPIYERCGWQPSESASEVDEFRLRREMVKKDVKKDALDVMDRLSEAYEKEYLGKVFLDEYRN